MSITVKRVTTSTLTAFVLVLTACENKETRYRAPVKQPSEAATASLRIKVPGPNAFPMSKGNPDDYLKNYLVRITADSRKCAAYESNELKDYEGSETLDLPLSTKCDFSVSFAIGKKGKSAGLQDKDPVFDAFYATEESFDIDSEDLKEGDVEIKLHLKRTKLGEKTGFTSEWVKDDLDAGDDSEQTDDTDQDDQDDQDSENDGDNDGNNSGSKLTYTDMKSVIDQSCASCHRPGGQRSGSDLSTYAGFKKFGANSVTRIVSGTMPPGGPLSADLVQKFKDWQAAGFPETSSGGSDNNADNDNDNSGDQTVVEFRIKAGTGSGAWNTPEAPVKLKVGQTLRIINDDTIRHRLHTDGAPCPHGNNIAPGQSEDCVISRPFTGANLYDHNNLGKFYIRAER